jgi:uncharacterized membrane protein (DUF485 family)
MARDGTSLEAAHASVQQLIAEKLRYLVPMTVIFMASYIGLTILAGFARDLMGTKVIGSVNLGLRADCIQLSAVMAAGDRLRAHRCRQVRSARREGGDGNLRARKLK